MPLARCREVVVRVLHDLRSEGVIRTGREGIEIVVPEGLIDEQVPARPSRARHAEPWSGVRAGRRAALAVRLKAAGLHGRRYGGASRRLGSGRRHVTPTAGRRHQGTHD